MAYSLEQIENIFDEVCNRIANGEALSKVLLTEGMPSRPKFYEWIESSQEKINKYARATEMRASLIFDDILEISDNTELGEKIKSNAQGKEITVGDMIEHRKLKIDARKWVLARMIPKKYGDKVGLEHSGEIKTNTTIIVQDNETQEILNKLMNDNDKGI